MYRYVGVVVLVGFVAFSAATPLGASYVYSDSMEPTINTGDGFVVVPTDDAGPGDIVTFWSDHRGEYVTHRVVAETESGYVTKGDNNPITDQAAGHQHVRQSDVEGAVLTLGGEPVTVPHVGDAVRFGSKHATVLAGAGVLVIATLARSSSPRSRDVLSSGTLLRGLIAASIVVGVVGVLLTGGTVRFPVSDDADGVTPETVVFENGTANMTISASETPYSYQAVAASGVRIIDKSMTSDDGESTDDGSARADEDSSASGEEITLTLARDGSEGDTATVRVYQYPKVLPSEVIRAAHAVHPLVAAVLTIGFGHLPVAALCLLTIDGREPLRSNRWRGPLRGK